MSKNAIYNKEKIALLKERGIWSAEDDDKMNEAATKIRELVGKLEKGGYDFNEAVQDAKECASHRAIYLLYSSALNQLMGDTVDSKAQEAELNFLISNSIADENGKLLCESVEDYLSKQDDEVIKKGEDVFSEYWFGKINFPEEDFIKEFNVSLEEPQEEKVERQPFTNIPEG